MSRSPIQLKISLETLTWMTFVFYLDPLLKDDWVKALTIDLEQRTNYHIFIKENEMLPHLTLVRCCQGLLSAWYNR